MEGRGGKRYMEEKKVKEGKVEDNEMGIVEC